jgi:hypothetical protein
MRIIFPILALFILNGCADLQNRPTSILIRASLAKPKQTIVLDSRKTPSELIALLTQGDCASGLRTTSGTAVVGANSYAPVRSSVYFSLENGKNADGSVWIGLRMDGMIHVLAAGMELRPNNGGTQITVTKIDKTKSASIQREIEAGSYFCDWRSYDYPYD